MAGEYILETEQLGKDFLGFIALKSVNLRVRRGSIHALIGPNGAGKTTCFNLLTKFLAPSRGTIRFDGREIVVRGRDLVKGRPAEITITEREVADALAEPVAQIVSAVRTALEKTAPELSADIIDEGITVTGGGALLRRIDVALSEATGLPVKIADEPLTCVAKGAGAALEDPVYAGILTAA